MITLSFNKVFRGILLTLQTATQAEFIFGSGLYLQKLRVCSDPANVKLANGKCVNDKVEAFKNKNSGV